MSAPATARCWLAGLVAAALVLAGAWTVRHRLRDGVTVERPDALATMPAEAAATTATFAAVHIEPGQEVYAIDLSAVVEIDFETGGRTVVVRRSRDSGPGGGDGEDFAVSVQADGAPTQPSCRGNGALADLLERLSSIRVTRVLGDDETAVMRQRYGASAATLRIRDRTTLDPKEFHVLFPNQPPPRALLLDGPALFESSLPRELFDRLSAGCDALGGRGQGRPLKR